MLSNKRDNLEQADTIHRGVQKAQRLSRRKLLAGAAGLAAATAVGGVATGQAITPAPTPRPLGGPATELGERSTHELLQRAPAGAIVSGPSYATTPLADLDGIITPSDLFFEVDHQTRIARWQVAADGSVTSGDVA